MAFVSGYDHDIFVSYASVNDQPRGKAPGWVTTFITELKKGLDWRIGVQNACTIWSSYGLTGNTPISTQLLEHAQTSATLIMVFSQAYVISPWCQQAQTGFLDTIRHYARADSRIFLVELDKTERPSVLRDIRGYQFFIEDPLSGRIRTTGLPVPTLEDTAYYTSIDELSEDLVKELRTLQHTPYTVLPTLATDRVEPVKSDAVATVLLAEEAADLYFVRTEIKHCLEQANIRVLPQTRYPLEPQAFCQAVRRDLDLCDCFVQVLSSVPFQTYPDLPQGRERCQFELAHHAKKPILQWREPELDIQAVPDAAQRKFLQSEHVYAIALESFKAEIVKKFVRRQRSDGNQQRKPPLVFVGKHDDDVALADQVCRVLQETFQVSYDSPRSSVRREAVERRLKRCDGLIIIYGSAEPEHLEWVGDFFWDIHDILPQRDRPLTALAVYDGPPETKPDITFGAPGMLLMKCRDCLREDQLREFVNALYAEGGNQ